MKQKLKEGDLILCTVKKIEKTSIFLEIEGNGEGAMVLSEVAAGRIRNLRQYVAPNKKIVCKVLNTENGHIELSLRRVTAKEREAVLEKYKKERNFSNLIKTITKSPELILEKIKQEYELVDFLEEVQNNPQILKNFFSAEDTKKLEKVLTEKIEKEKLLKKIFSLSTTSSTGLTDIKEILNIKNAQINYLGSARFSISSKADNLKEANKKLTEILQEIEKRAKQKKALFELKEK